MSSIGAALTARDICAQIRMERQRHKGAFLLMEGTTDVRRFSEFLRIETCSMINCNGKSNVLDAVEINQNGGFEDCLGFVDLDFDRVLNAEIDDDDIVCSEHHDFDLDICATSVIERYLVEVADPQKMNTFENVAACVDALLLALKPLSAMRFANVRHGLGYSFRNIDLENFFDGSILDIGEMVDRVSQGRFNSVECKDALRAQIDRYCDSEIDLWQLTNGHDFMAGLGIALRNRIGNRRNNQTWRSEVEIHLRLALRSGEFVQTGIAAKISQWEQRSNHMVLR